MKLPIRILAIAFLLAFAVMFLANSPPGEVMAAERSDSAQASQDLSTVTPTIVGVQIVADVQQVKPWVRESVGLPPLNLVQVTFSPVKELEGHRTVIAKPKIVSLHDMIPDRYRGLGSDHFARADV